MSTPQSIPSNSTNPNFPKIVDSQHQKRPSLKKKFLENITELMGGQIKALEQMQKELSETKEENKKIQLNHEKQKELSQILNEDVQTMRNKDKEKDDEIKELNEKFNAFRKNAEEEKNVSAKKFKALEEKLTLVTNNLYKLQEQAKTNDAANNKRQIDGINEELKPLNEGLKNVKKDVQLQKDKLNLIENKVERKLLSALGQENQKLMNQANNITGGNTMEHGGDMSDMPKPMNQGITEDTRLLLDNQMKGLDNRLKQLEQDCYYTTFQNGEGQIESTVVRKGVNELFGDNLLVHLNDLVAYKWVLDQLPAANDSPDKLNNIIPPSHQHLLAQVEFEAGPQRKRYSIIVPKNLAKGFELIKHVYTESINFSTTYVKQHVERLQNEKTLAGSNHSRPSSTCSSIPSNTGPPNLLRTPSSGGPAGPPTIGQSANTLSPNPQQRFSHNNNGQFQNHIGNMGNSFMSQPQANVNSPLVNPNMQHMQHTNYYTSSNNITPQKRTADNANFNINQIEQTQNNQKRPNMMNMNVNMNLNQHTHGVTQQSNFGIMNQNQTFSTTKRISQGVVTGIQPPPIDPEYFKKQVQPQNTLGQNPNQNEIVNPIIDSNQPVQLFKRNTSSRNNSGKSGNNGLPGNQTNLSPHPSGVQPTSTSALPKMSRPNGNNAGPPMPPFLAANALPNLANNNNSPCSQGSLNENFMPPTPEKDNK